MRMIGVPWKNLGNLENKITGTAATSLQLNFLQLGMKIQCCQNELLQKREIRNQDFFNVDILHVLVLATSSKNVQTQQAKQNTSSVQTCDLCLSSIFASSWITINYLDHISLDLPEELQCNHVPKFFINKGQDKRKYLYPLYWLLLKTFFFYQIIYYPFLKDI